MARTSYPKRQMFVPIDCGKLAFENISLDEAIKSLKKNGFKNVKVKKLEINGIEDVNIAESLLEDFSSTNIETEKLDLSTAVPHRQTRRRKKRENVTGAITEILDTDIMKILNIDVSAPLQEAFDNIISMISVNQESS